MTGVGEQDRTAARPPDAAEPKGRDRVGRVLKWVGGVSAVLSLVFALVLATELVTDSSSGCSRTSRPRATASCCA